MNMLNILVNKSIFIILGVIIVIISAVCFMVKIIERTLENEILAANGGNEDISDY
jgi:hypothetical protein